MFVRIGFVEMGFDKTDDPTETFRLKAFGFEVLFGRLCSVKLFNNPVVPCWFSCGVGFLPAFPYSFTIPSIMARAMFFLVFFNFVISWKFLCKMCWKILKISLFCVAFNFSQTENIAVVFGKFGFLYFKGYWLPTDVARGESEVWFAAARGANVSGGEVAWLYWVFVTGSHATTHG